MKVEPVHPQVLQETIMDRASPTSPVVPSAERTRLARRWPVIALAVATLAGCASTPLSYVYDNQVYYRAIRDRYPVFILAVDGSSPAYRPVPVTPGEHVMRLDAAAVGGFSERVTKNYPITIEPCTRYYIAAQRQTALSQDWELVVERTFPVGGCDADAERAKAKTAAISGLPLPASSIVQSVAVLDENVRR